MSRAVDHRRIPRATLLFLATALGVQIGVAWTGLSDPENAREAHRRRGAAQVLKVTRNPDVRGPLDLWDGELWRVPVSAFHHGSLFGPGDGKSFAGRAHLGDLPHLFFNGLALWLFGALLEPRLGTWRFGLFFLSACVVSFLPEYLMGHAPVGLSGGLCGLLGLAIVMRADDESLRERLPSSAIWTILAWLVLGVVLTAFDVVPVANAAHAAGLAYGLAWGEVRRVWLRNPNRGRLLCAVFLSSHLLLAAGYAFVVAPSGNGTYHWYRSLAAEDPDERAAALFRAVEADPRLAGAWRELAAVQFREGRPLEAWSTILAGVDHNRSDTDAVALARFVWRSLGSAERRAEAERLLERRFGEGSDRWRERLTVPVITVAAAGDDEEVAEPPDARPAFPTEVGVRAERDLSAPPVDVDDPESAVLGTRL